MKEVSKRMTIKQIAKELDKSTQAIYARLKADNVPIESLKVPITGELTPDGETKIRAYYQTALSNSSQEIDNPDKQNSQLNGLLSEVDSLTTKLKTLTGELETANQTIARLTDDIQAARQTAADAQAQTAQALRLLDQQQQLQAQTLRALPQPRQGGLFARLFKR